MGSVDFQQLNSLLIATQHFPEKTPNRWKLIVEFIRGQPPQLGEPLKVMLPVSPKRHLALEDIPTCQKIYKLLKASYPAVFTEVSRSCLYGNQNSAMKPIILLPFTTDCCMMPIKIDSRCSYPIVFTMSGTYVAAMFHGVCSICKTRYYVNHYIKDGKRYYVSPTTSEYFQVTSATVFHKTLLMDICNNVWISGTPFFSRAQVYNETFGVINAERLKCLDNFDRTVKGDWELNEQRIRDGFFLWVVVGYFDERNLLETRAIDYEYSHGVSRHLNTEKMCQETWKDITSSPNPWVAHSCRTKGCSEGYVTIDGNEKLIR